MKMGRPKLTKEYVEKEIEKYGGKLLGEYIGSNYNVTIVCSCGHSRNTLYWRFIDEEDSHLCKECSKKWKKYKTTEYIRNELKKVGCKLIGEYADYRTNITVECLCGHKKQTRFHSFMRSDSTRLCKDCSPANTYGLKTDYVRSVVESFGSQLVGEYIRADIKINVKCLSCGKIFGTIFNNYKLPNCTHLCKKCASLLNSSKRVPEQDEMMKRFFDRGFIVIDRNQIRGMTNKVDLVDEDGYKYCLSMATIKGTARRVDSNNSRFGNNNPFTLYNMNLWAEKEGKEVDILSISKNKTNRLQVEIFCRRCGNKRTLNWSSINSNGNGCSYCSITKGERRIKYFLEQNNIDFTFQKKYDDCKDKYVLRFDFHLWDYNTIIEYDGEGHFEPRDFKGKGEEWAIDQFHQTQKRDAIKTKYCEDNGIPILRIPYWQKEEIPEILTSYLHL
jgi:hypothetical protein